jgi:hypothetical protein
MNKVTKIIPLATLAILLFAISPLAYASTLTVNLNPKTGLANVDSVSTTKIVFTYPANSTISKYLRNASSSSTFSGSFMGTSEGAHEFQGTLHDWDNRISVSNMSVALNYSLKGNMTALVLDETADVNATVSGVFRVVNGTVMADLGWRSFIVRGAMILPLNGHTIDINLAGSVMQDSLGPQSYASGWMMGAFGGGNFWNRPTLNFSALDTPLSTWTKNYNSATNTTTFTKTIAGSSTFTASYDFNGQKYSLSATSDPTGVVAIQGYANASGDSLVIAPAPASASSTSSLLAIGAVVAVLALLGGFYAVKRGVKPKSSLAS